MENLKSKGSKKELYRQLAVVAVPIALQSLVASSLNLIDNLMVGFMGEAELGAVGAGMQIYFIGWIFLFGFSAGASTFVAQFWGAKDLVNIRKTMGFAIVICEAVGLVFFMSAFFAPEVVMRVFTNIPQTIELGAQYVKWGSACFLLMPVLIILEMSLRSTQQTKIPMYISFIAFAMNTFMNWVLIFGHFGLPTLGVRGAALATVVSRIVELSLDIIVIFVRKNKIAGPLREFFGWSRELAVRVVRNSLPTMINEGAWSVATSMYVAAYARVGVTEYAAYQAAETIDVLFVMGAFSLGDAALIIIGAKLGEGKLEEAYDIAKTILKACVLVGVIASVLLALCSGPMVSLFNFTEEGTGDARLILLVFSGVLTVDVLCGALVTGVLRSGGDTRFAMLADVGTIWLIGVPMAWISTAVMHWPIYIAVALSKMELVVKVFIVMARFISKKWVRNVISNI